MPDITDQLAVYFDMTVERVTAEDVLTSTSGVHPLPDRRRATRPVVAFIAAAVAVIVLIGGVGWLIGRGTGLETENQVAAPGLVVAPQPSLEDQSGFGTISISIEGWEGAEDYQLLAGAWNDDNELVGGALWIKVDSDPFFARDVVHPANPNNTRNLAPEMWGLEDYLWSETARLEPGIYSITFWANPEVLHPYGSHLPAEPIERRCALSVEVKAGKVSTVQILEIPAGSWEACPIPDGS